MDVTELRLVEWPVQEEGPYDGVVDLFRPCLGGAESMWERLRTGSSGSDCLALQGFTEKEAGLELLFEVNHHPRDFERAAQREIAWFEHTFVVVALSMTVAGHLLLGLVVALFAAVGAADWIRARSLGPARREHLRVDVSRQHVRVEIGSERSCSDLTATSVRLTQFRAMSPRRRYVVQLALSCGRVVVLYESDDRTVAAKLARRTARALNVAWVEQMVDIEQDCCGRSLSIGEYEACRKPDRSSRSPKERGDGSKG